MRNLENKKRLNQKYRHSNRKKEMLRHAYDRAKRKGIEFALAEADIGEIPKVCPILGIPLFYSAKRCSKNTPSIDRIDNKKGYIPTNVRIISLLANAQKGAR